MHKRQTKVVPKSLDPRWDERLLFPGALAELQATTLVIKVRDKDKVGFDDHLGEVRVPLAPLRSSSRLEFAQVRVRARARVRVRVRVTSSPRWSS